MTPLSDPVAEIREALWQGRRDGLLLDGRAFDAPAWDAADAALATLEARLREVEAERDEWKATCEVLEDGTGVALLADEIQELKATVARLQEALREIADATRRGRDTAKDATWQGFAARLQRLARAVLASEAAATEPPCICGKGDPGWRSDCPLHHPPAALPAVDAPNVAPAVTADGWPTPEFVVPAVDAPPETTT